MSDQQQQQEAAEPQTSNQEATPESNTSSPQQSSPQQMYQQAVQDINGLPVLGRIALAVCVIIVLFKLTPVLDLIWLFLQIVVIPCLILISIGVISHETYMMFIGWLNESLIWVRSKRDEINQQTTSPGGQ